MSFIHEDRCARLHYSVYLLHGYAAIVTHQYTCIQSTQEMYSEPSNIFLKVWWCHNPIILISFITVYVVYTQVESLFCLIVSIKHLMYAPVSAVVITF